MPTSPRASRFFPGTTPVLVMALVSIFGGSPAMAQQTRPHPLNPPALPPTAHSSRPVAPRHANATPSATPGPSASLSESTWTAIGPASLDSGVSFASSNGLVSGRVTGVAVDPSNPNNIYLASAGGGVWKTTDGGAAWTPLTDKQATLAMGSIAIAPSNPSKIYAGTGEANFSVDSNHGNGILISNDAGATWSLATAGGAFTKNVIGQIAVDPVNANIAYAAVGGYPENGIFAHNGIWKTTDGGATWTNTTAAASLNSEMAWTAVVVDPNTPSIVYAAIGDIYNQNNVNGVYRSTDSGSTWSLLANAPNDNNTGRIALAVSPVANQTGQHVLYVAVASSLYTGVGGLYFFGRSDNADAATPTFTDLTSTTPDFLGAENGSGQGWYDIAVNVDSNGVLYCAGVENYADGTQAILTSSDLGVSWTDISIVNGAEPHTDNHAIAFDSSDGMILGNDGGIFLYDPTGPSWTDLNSNLNTIQFTGIGLHPTSITTVVGGSQDNGTELYGDNLLWEETAGGDGGFAQISQTTPTRCYAVHPIGSFGPTTFFQRSDSTCAAGSWVAKSNGLSFNNSNFYPPFVVDPTNGNHLLMGLDYVNETTNAGDLWTPIGAPGVGNFNNADASVDSVALAPANSSNPQVIYAATGGTFATSSQIFVTSDDGNTWAERDLPTCTPNDLIGEGCRVNQIITDPSDPTGQTAFAVIGEFSANSGGHVFMTTNAGASWADISGNLPNQPTWSVQVDTDTNHTLYISNDTGVYSSPSPYSTWSAVGSGLPHVQGVDLELNSNLHVLGVATHGRGAWEILRPGAQLALTVIEQGPGAGSVSSSPSGISCGTTCSANFPAPSKVSLTASTDSNSIFAGWSGCDSVSGNVCSVTMTASRSVTANFMAKPTVTWPTASAITYGQTLSASVLTGGSASFNSTPVPGAFAFASPTTAPAAGVQSESVTFTPTDTNLYASVTGTVNVTVDQATPVILWATPAAIVYGTPITSAQLNATSSVAGTFSYTPISGTLLAAGSQTLKVTLTPTDAADYNTVTASVTLTVSQAVPVITLTSSQSSSNPSQPVTFTATVSSPVGAPSGSVLFFDGTTQLGSGALAGGAATYTTSTLASGVHSISARYSGDNNFAAITSAAVTQTVSSFSISTAGGTSSTASVAPSGTASYVLSVIPPGSTPVTFSVTGLPSGASSGFSPSTVAAGAGPSMVEFFIYMPAEASAIPAQPAPGQSGPASRMPIALGLILLPLLGLRKFARGARRFFLFVLLAITGAAATLALSGCTHNFSTSSNSNPPPPATYTLTVTATAGTQTQSINLTLIVE